MLTPVFPVIHQHIISSFPLYSCYHNLTDFPFLSLVASSFELILRMKYQRRTRLLSLVEEVGLQR